MMNLLMLYRNSIGDINAPEYGYWLDVIDNSNESDGHFGASYMIFICWFIWFIHQYLVLIILLNFLIAIISQSYDSVMTTSLITKYNQRCDMNWECTLLNEQFNKFLRKFKYGI